MKLAIVSKNLSKKLSEIGCDLEKCDCGGHPTCICVDTRIHLELARMWFRDVYGLDIKVVVYNDDDYQGFLIHDSFEYQDDEKYYKSYELALEKVLIEACKEIKLGSLKKND